jgi:hypothetical protein
VNVYLAILHVFINRPLLKPQRLKTNLWVESPRSTVLDMVLNAIPIVIYVQVFQERLTHETVVESCTRPATEAWPIYILSAVRNLLKAGNMFAYMQASVTVITAMTLP